MRHLHPSRNNGSAFLSGFIVAIVGVIGPCRCFAQVTWGPQYINEVDDLANQQRLYDLLRRAYFSDYGPNNQQHSLEPAMRAEIAEFRSRVQREPALALGVGMAKYHFAWYKMGEAEMDVENVEDAADLMYAGIQFSGCNRPDLPMEAFFQRMCNARWPYTVMLYSELGREFASRYLTEQAATILEKAIAAFDEMKRLPYYAAWTHWQSPYDMNFNEEWFPGVQPSGPIWDKARIPLAQFLESNFQVIAGELGSLLDRGLLDPLHFEGIRAEGQDYAPSNGWRAVEFVAVEPQAGADPWATRACREAPKTCALLKERPELQGCQYAGASLVSLRPGGRLKPQFGAAPKLHCHLTLKADPGPRMSVGNQTVMWKTGEAMVFDDTYVRQEWHNGLKGDRYVLQVTFCHPCEDSQRLFYAGSVVCPPSQATTTNVVPEGNSVPQGSATYTVASVQTSAPMPVEAVLNVPFAAAAAWAATLPELAQCTTGIGERCPPDTQHGGPNPLSALNTWNYALNNLKAALRHTRVEVDPALTNTMAQVQSAIQSFLKLPALDQFLPIVTTAAQIFEAMLPWLQQQQPAQVRFLAAQPAMRLPSDGKTPLGQVTFPLASTLRMPAVGFGTWKLEGISCYNAVKWALELGIRHIDTAEAYGNEVQIGQAIRDSGAPRSDLFLTTKATSVALGMADASSLEVILNGQLQALQTTYIDVYMLHAAGVKGEQLRAVWQGMERAHDLGLARALGVSNFGVEELEELWGFARVKPAYLQNIFKVYKQGEQILSGGVMGILEWAERHGVAMVGYSGINHWPHILPPLQDPHVRVIANVHGKTTSQVLNRWALQHGIAVIPKASSKERIRENSMLFDFELSPCEMAALDGLATLSESTFDQLRPTWHADVYGLFGNVPTMPPLPANNALHSGGTAMMGTGSAAERIAPADAPRAAALGGGSGFAEVLKDRQCNRDLPNVKGEPFTLGGGGHQLAQCQAECSSQIECKYITFYHKTGYCHMYRSCQEQKEAGDSAVIYARM